MPNYLEYFGVGASRYDLAHYFTKSPVGSGGGLGACCVCMNQDGGKTQGGTGMENPSGDNYNVDYVAHEIGHQFGQGHTFTGIKGQCGGNFDNRQAVEVGAGRTIVRCRYPCTRPPTSVYFGA